MAHHLSSQEPILNPVAIPHHSRDTPRSSRDTRRSRDTHLNRVTLHNRGTHLNRGTLSNSLATRKLGSLLLNRGTLQLSRLGTQWEVKGILPSSLAINILWPKVMELILGHPWPRPMGLNPEHLWLSQLGRLGLGPLQGWNSVFLVKSSRKLTSCQNQIHSVSCPSTSKDDGKRLEERR